MNNQSLDTGLRWDGIASLLLVETVLFLMSVMGSCLIFPVARIAPIEWADAAIRQSFSSRV